ncbi:MAG: hypothetical protein KZQ99_22695, partial [Candidatus Thiodiazotropha sp. (ex Dulcina madagascariensis)]|nr:hypothetical protein [Candidatus Thiodiazotropha sp. (ex Dulcina madagascariensis)]
VQPLCASLQLAHQNAAVAPLQQVLITLSVGWHTAACRLNINWLGASSRPLLGVVTLAKGINPWRRATP